MIKGSYVALVTPFRNREIDWNALEQLIEFHVENKTDGILLCGTTGESPSLAGDEKEQLVRFCIKKIARRIPVMVGTGTNNLAHTVAATQRAMHEGADSALVVVPYYNKPTQEGLYRFFKAVADQVNIPIMIYNIPGRTGVNMNADTILRVARECKNIVGVKEASGNLNQANILARDGGPDFSVMSGDDPLNIPMMSIGAKGTISVTANIVPRQLHDLIALAADGDFKGARVINDSLIELNQALFLETNPIPVKEAMAMMGMIQDEIRLPLCKMGEENHVKLRKVLLSQGLIK